ncbi:hypothetical protein C8R45DRAFT_941252 [Mycena sanguinolenta]|nr:hypothetical protein C8R45DRAFT_941252 [Mycena sanguinolenta]
MKPLIVNEKLTGQVFPNPIEKIEVQLVLIAEPRRIKRVYKSSILRKKDIKFRLLEPHGISTWQELKDYDRTFQVDWKSVYRCEKKAKQIRTSIKVVRLGRLGASDRQLDRTNSSCADVGEQCIYTATAGKCHQYQATKDARESARWRHAGTACRETRLREPQYSDERQKFHHGHPARPELAQQMSNISLKYSSVTNPARFQPLYQYENLRAGRHSVTRYIPTGHPPHAPYVMFATIDICL